jgi:hypothetical protein
MFFPVGLVTALGTANEVAVEVDEGRPLDRIKVCQVFLAHEEMLACNVRAAIHIFMALRIWGHNHQVGCAS